MLGLLRTQIEIIRYYSVFGCNSIELWLTVYLEKSGLILALLEGCPKYQLKMDRQCQVVIIITRIKTFWLPKNG